MDSLPRPEASWGNLWKRVQIHVSTSLRLDLSVEWWRFDLMSPFWRLYVNDRSGAWIEFNGKRLDLAPDHLYLIPAWVRFQTGTLNPISQSFIHFYITGFPPTLLHQLFERPYSLPLLAPLDVLVQQWQNGLASQAAPGLAESSWSYALVHAALALCATNVGKEQERSGDHLLSESSLMWPAIERIENHLDRPALNAELAALCHLSTDHFVRQFRRSVGMTPAQYGLERRIAAAAHQLINSSRSVEDIAATTGFTDRFHFSKTFKQRLQTSPVAYRKMHWQKN